MDIAELSMVLSQTKVKHQASLSVTKMAMDTGKGQANDMLKMLEGASPAGSQVPHPNLGNTIDIKL